MEKFIQNLHEAEELARKANHLIYSAFPIAKDKKILTSALEKLKNSVAKSINAILQYEYSYKKIKLYKDANLNMQTFETKCAKEYSLDEKDTKLIRELFESFRVSKKSSVDFLKENKMVFVVDYSEHLILPIEKIKEFLVLSKKVLENFNHKIRWNFDKI